MRVLIIGSPDVRGGLAAVRALGRSGWEVGYGSPRRDSLICRSRWLTRTHEVPWPQQGMAAFHTALTSAIENGRYEAVFAAGDVWLRALDSVRDSLDARVAYAPSESLITSMDKAELVGLSEGAGILAPRTVEATPQQIDAWSGPAVVKPRRHWLEGGVDSTVHLSTAIASDRASIRRHVTMLRGAGATPVLQELIEGPMIALTVLTDERSRTVARMQQSVHRVWPTPAGVSTAASTMPVDGVLAARVEVLLRALNWLGLAQLQFIVGPVGPVLIDLNARYYGSMSLAMRAGLDLPVLWARLATGRHVGARYDALVGARYSWLEGDLRRAVSERRGGLAKDVLNSLDWGRSAGHSIVDLRDPMPACTYSAELFGRAVRKVGRHVR